MTRSPRSVTASPGLGIGLVAGLVVGVVAGVVAGVVGTFGGGLVTGLVAGLSQPGAGNASPLSPCASWRRDQALGLLTGLVAGLIAGLGTGLGAGLVGGVVAGLLAMLVGGLAYPMTWAASLAFAQLARRWHTPLRLMRFLEDARKRDVLRTVGPVYQFRHARLQDRLGDQHVQ